MATLQARVESRIGTVTETDLLGHALQEAVDDICNAIPRDKAYRYAVEKSALASAGVTVKGRVFEVRNGDRPATMVPASKQKDVVAGSSTSIYKASEVFPAAWQKGGKIYGYPTSSTLYVTVLEPPAVSPSDSTITSLPPGTDEASVLYACWQILLARTFDEAVPSVGTFPTPPTPPTAPSFTYTDAVAGSISSNPINTPPTPPTYNGPTELDDMLNTLNEGDIGTSLDQTDTSKWFSVLSKIIENEEDPELAVQAVGRIRAFTEAAIAHIQNAVNKFQEEVVEYEALIQEDIVEAQLNQERLSTQARLETETSLANELQTLSQQVQEYSAKLQLYQSEVQSYSAQVQSEVNDYNNQLTEYQAKIARNESQVQGYKSRYYEKLQLITSTDDGTTIDRARS